MEKKNESLLEINYLQSFKTDSSVNYKDLKQSCKRDFEVTNNEDIFFISGESKDKIVIDNEELFNNFIKKITQMK
jgi:transcriptional regulator of NAD metabolism